MRNANSKVFITTKLVDLVVNIVIHFNTGVLLAKVYINYLIIIILLLLRITKLCTSSWKMVRKEEGEGKGKEGKVKEENLRRVNQVFSPDCCELCYLHSLYC